MFFSITISQLLLILIGIWIIFPGYEMCGKSWNRISVPNCTREGQWIVQGQKSKPGTWPWQVSVGYSCGGSLIHPKFVLTAAHCVTNDTENDLTIYAGHTNPLEGESFEVERIYQHPGFNYNYTYDHIPLNDIALIELKQNIPETNLINTICLPYEEDVVQHQQDCYATGYGYNTFTNGPMDISVLHEVCMPYIDNSLCQKLYAENNETADGVVCAGYRNGLKSICFGDSGGPLACKVNNTWKIFGIASYLIGETGFNVGIPPVFTDVKTYLSWINSIVYAKQ